MMTPEENAAIDRECEQQHISQQDYLDSHGIARHQYYRCRFWDASLGRTMHR